jgi:hypothetical protein
MSLQWRHGRNITGARRFGVLVHDSINKKTREERGVQGDLCRAKSKARRALRGTTMRDGGLGNLLQVQRRCESSIV